MTIAAPAAVLRGRDLLARAARPGPRPADWLRAETPATGGRAEIYIYGPIDSWGGVWGVSAAEVAELLATLAVAEIDLHLNSPGGMYWEGVSIHNLLRQHQARITCYVDGLAASAASVVAMAADHIVMGAGAQLMIHDARCHCSGNPTELRETAEWLDALCQDAAGFYARRAGGAIAAWRDEMRAERWYTAEEAVAAGLADEAVTGDPDPAQDDDPATAAAVIPVTAAQSTWRYPGRAGAPAPSIPAAAAAAAPSTRSRAARARARDAARRCAK